MATDWGALGKIDPRTLGEARALAHHAVQWLTRLARANLAPRPDDSHSSLVWDGSLRALVTHDLLAPSAVIYRLGLVLESLTLIFVEGPTVVGDFGLDSRTDADARDWIDGTARQFDLHSTGKIATPYTISSHPVDSGGTYAYGPARAALAELARWFNAADEILQETRVRLASIVPGPSPVRCWPHHFDIATLVTLRAGDPETVPAIGIGMSPGDNYYAEPYFYLSPWPAPSNAALPALSAPGRWHTEGFTGAIATATDVLALPNRRAGLHRFIDETVALSRNLLKA